MTVRFVASSAIELPFWTLVQFFRFRAHHDNLLRLAALKRWCLSDLLSMRKSAAKDTRRAKPILISPDVAFQNLANLAAFHG